MSYWTRGTHWGCGGVVTTENGCLPECSRCGVLRPAGPTCYQCSEEIETRTVSKVLLHSRKGKRYSVRTLEPRWLDGEPYHHHCLLKRLHERMLERRRANVRV